MSKKDEYIAKARAQFEEQVARLDQLKAQAKQNIADTKVDAMKRIEELEQHAAEARTRLEAITDVAEDKFEEAKAKFESTAAGLKDSIQNLLKR